MRVSLPDPTQFEVIFRTVLIAENVGLEIYILLFAAKMSMGMTLLIMQLIMAQRLL